MNTKTIGLTLFIIGIVYMVIDGWLISWWVVPDYKEMGDSFISGESFYHSNSFFAIWALSVPLGSLITSVGLMLYVRLEKLSLLIFIAGGVIFLSWLAIWSQSVLYPVLYGVGGGIILISFIISIWYLVKVRMIAEEKIKKILELRALGYIFLVITAWGMCGLLGAPSFGISPDKIQSFNTHGILITMGAKVLICFVIATLMLAISQYLEYRVYNHLSTK